MAILGLLLLLAVTGLAVDVVLQNTSSISVEAVGATFSISPGWLFVAGLATGVIGVLGVSLLVVGITRARRRRAVLAESRSSLHGLQAERDRLAVELERERAARTSTAAEIRRHDDPPAQDREPTVIDVSDDRRSEPTDDDVAIASAARREPADNREHMEVGRRGLFQRRS